MASRAHNPLTEAEIARIAEMHAAGKTRNDIAKELGRSGDTISKHCKKAGLTFDRAATEAATKAKTKDAAARRADAQLAELEILELRQGYVLKVLKGQRKHKKLVRDGFGDVPKELDFLPADDDRMLTQSRAASTTIIGNLARLDADRGDEAVKSLLIGFAHKLGLVDEPVT